MENKKIKIHEFVLSPYPRRLWVMKGGDYAKLNKFYFKCRKTHKSLASGRN